MLVASVVCLPVFASVLGLFFAFVSFGPFFSLAFLLALDFCTRFRRLFSWNCVFWIQGFWGGAVGDFVLENPRVSGCCALLAGELLCIWFVFTDFPSSLGGLHLS